MSFGSVTASGIGHLKFVFKKFDKQCPTSSWHREVHDGEKNNWVMRIRWEAEPIDLGDDSEDENDQVNAPLEDAGDVESGDPMLSVQLFNHDNNEAHAAVLFRTTDQDKKEHTLALGLRLYSAEVQPEATPFLSLPDAMRTLNLSGSLVVDVLLQFRVSHMYSPCVSQHLLESMSNLFRDGEGEDADFSFRVSGEHVQAHAFVLMLQSKVLRDAWMSRTEESGDHVIISCPEGIAKEGLLAFLGTLYGLPISQSLSVELKKQVVFLADTYQVNHVRIAAEIALVEGCLMTDANVLEWYQFAKSKTCPLLQQQAEEYFFLRAHAMRCNQDTKLISESKETLMELLGKASERLSATKDDLNVDQLRTEIAKIGRENDLDGDKAILVHNLERLQSPRKRSLGPRSGWSVISGMWKRGKGNSSSGSNDSSESLSMD